jgi:hypothetical protein
MEHARLIVHRGAVRVTRDHLAEVPTPPATATWKPIPHALLVSAIHEELGRRALQVVHEEYAVQRQQTMLFGVMTLNWLTTETFAAALAFRHANDRSEAVKMYAGARVLACDNMLLSGSEIILHKRHSRRFDLAAALPDAFDKYQAGALQIATDIATLQDTPCAHRDATQLIYDIFRRRIVPIRLFHPVVASWQRSQPDDRIPGTAWVLHNCFTEHIKHLTPNVAMQATVRLGRFFGLGHPGSLDERQDAPAPTTPTHV